MINYDERANKNASKSTDDVKLTSVPIYEQETNILFKRDEDFASVYSSDRTMITKLDNLCRASPEMYQLIEDTGYGKRYRLADKTLVCLRTRKMKREYTDEQRKAIAERFHGAKDKISAEPSIDEDIEGEV